MLWASGRLVWGPLCLVRPRARRLRDRPGDSAARWGSGARSRPWEALCAFWVGWVVVGKQGWESGSCNQGNFKVGVQGGAYSSAIEQMGKLSQGVGVSQSIRVRGHKPVGSGGCGHFSCQSGCMWRRPMGWG